MHITKEKRNKLDYKSEEGMLIGCLENSVYKVWRRDHKEAICCRDVRIAETSFPGPEWLSTEDVSFLPGSNRVPPVTPTVFPTADGFLREELSGTEATPLTDEEIDIITYVPEQPPPISGTDQVQGVATQSQNHSEALDRRYPPRERSPPDFFMPGQANVKCIFPQPQPHTIEEAFYSNVDTKWNNAIFSELLSLREHQTRRIVPRPKNAKALQTRFVFKRKYNRDRSVSRHKARLVVKGFLQIQVLDTFAPVVDDFNAVRIALSQAVQKGIQIHQQDIRTAFLRGDVDDDVYVSPPDELPICGPTEALKLAKGLYGLKQAPRLWKDKFKTTVQEIRFQSLRSDECVFVKNTYVCYNILVTLSSLVLRENHSQLRRLL